MPELDQETLIDEQNTNTNLSPLFRLAVLVLLTLAPVFAHGCHGDDVDDELFGDWITAPQQ